MKILLAAVLLSPVLSGCTVNRMDKDPEANFRHVFGEPAKELKVLQGVVYCYWWTSDDWEFELQAPASWVESQKDYLRKLPEKPQWEDGVRFPGRFWRPEYAPPWFAPGDPTQYELWQMCITSIPYRHLYIEKASIGRDLLHVYYRKD